MTRVVAIAAALGARALLAALISMDRGEVRRYAVPGANLDIPFVVRLIGNEWKVEPQPYFALINQ